MKKLLLLLTLGFGLWTLDSFAAITFAHLDLGNCAACTSKVTNSFTPVGNRLVLLIVVSQHANPINTPTISATTTGLTFVQVSTVPFSTIAAPGRRITLFRAMVSGPGSGTATIDFGGQSQTVASYTIEQAAAVNTSGTNGSGAVVQSVTNSADSGTSLTVTLAALADATNNAVFGAFNNSGVDMTVGSGYTSLTLNDNASGRMTTEYKVPGTTTPNVTAASTAWGGIGIEIAAAKPSFIILTKRR